MNDATTPTNPHAGSPDADSRPRGSRVRHSTLPAGMVLSRVGRHHFAFFKSWLEGLDIVAMGRRYLEPTDGINLHERTIRDTLRWIRQDLTTLARRSGQYAYARAISLNPEQLASSPDVPTLDEFREERDPHAFYSETELLELFEAEYAHGGGDSRKQQRNARLRARQAAALSWLETQVNVDPALHDPVEAWLVPTLSAHLKAAGITTLGELVTLINTEGQRWHRKVRNLGEKSAGRIMGWLVMNEYPLKTKISAHALVKRSQLDVGTMVQTRPKTCGIVPLEFFQPLHELDGSRGANRGDRNMTGAHNDYEAIHLWLKTVQHNPNTYRSYRKEAERFLLWSILERGKPISSLLVDDCMAYRDFLYDLGRLPDKVWDMKYRVPQANWLGKRGVARWSDAWRPFECPPVDRFRDPDAQVSLLAGTPDKIIYLKPVLTLPSQKLAQTVLKTLCEWLSRQRYLHSNPWDGVPPLHKQQLKIQVNRSFSIPVWESILAYIDSLPVDDNTARLRFILRFGQGTGLRLAEMTSALCSDIRLHESPTGAKGWVMRVIGKGMKEREVVVPSHVIDALRRYLVYRGYASLSEIPADTPLIDRMPGARSPALPSPVGVHEVEQLPLSHGAVYKALKRFFQEAAVALRDQYPDSVNQIRKASTHWLRHTSGSHAAAKGVPMEVIRDNLGHSSLTTTSIYVTADLDRRIEEMEKMA